MDLVAGLPECGVASVSVAVVSPRGAEKVEGT
jgi:hypothetical protein